MLLDYNVSAIVQCDDGLAFLKIGTDAAYPLLPVGKQRHRIAAVELGREVLHSALHRATNWEITAFCKPLQPNWSWSPYRCRAMSPDCL